MKRVHFGPVWVVRHDGGSSITGMRRSRLVAGKRGLWLLRPALHRSFDLNQLGLEIGGDFHNALQRHLQEWVGSGLVCCAGVGAKQLRRLSSFCYFLFHHDIKGRGSLGDKVRLRFLSHGLKL